ncbi:MAG: SDR family NAD(P)-dependent oxidoreductase [Promethearchaeota archaeon]|nr:MAG: SDR family NAD(P)-dependent oxidoreductase [Candidatus Lokiarchaeota archaeon]
MKEFKDKVAVITGAASGIGLGIARRAAKEGMKVVLADIEKDALLAAEEELKSKGVDVISIVTDVSKIEDVENLAQKTIDKFGEVHLLCNNAGVASPGFLWETRLNDWKWALGVNLWGIIHGILTFIPIMIQQDTECHIINTSSMAGLMSGDAWNGIYSVSKQGVVALSESLKISLNQLRHKINVSVLCPGIVTTNIARCERNRPEEFCDPDFEPYIERIIKKHPHLETMAREMVNLWDKGTSADEAGDIVFEAIRRDIFYILTETGRFWKRALEKRFKGIMDDYDKNHILIKEFKDK